MATIINEDISPDYSRYNTGIKFKDGSTVQILVANGAIVLYQQYTGLLQRHMSGITICDKQQAGKLVALLEDSFEIPSDNYKKAYAVVYGHPWEANDENNN